MNVFEYIIYLYLIIKLFAMVYKDLQQENLKSAIISFVASLIVITACWLIAYGAINKVLIF